MSKLTKRIVESALPSSEDVFIWDSELRGFCLKVTPKGKKVYMLYYRTKDKIQRKPVIGVHGIISCDEARQIAIEWLAEIGKGGDPSLKKVKPVILQQVTIHDLAIKYLEEYAPKKKPRSQTEDKRLWNNHILPKLGNILVKDITGSDITRLHNSMHKHPVNANRMLKLLSKALNLAEEWGYRDSNTNPCRNVKKYPEKSRSRYLSMDEISRLMKVLDESHEPQNIIAAIKLLLFTGCRLSEILTLKWEYIDLDNYRIDLPDSKTGQKSIYIPDYVISLLKTLTKQEHNPYVIYGKNPGTYLVNLQKPWRRIRKQANLDDVRIHDLRHSFASVAAACGLSLPVIGALLGHTNVDTTSRYAHLTNTLLRDAVKLIGNKMESVIRDS